MLMGTEEYYQKNLKHNFFVTIMEGAFLSFGSGMAPLMTVLMFFVSGFVEQKWIIGLFPCLFFSLILTPQAFVSKRIEGLRTYKGFSVFMTLLSRLPWLLLALDVFLFADTNPTLFIVIFYILFSIIGLTAGFAGMTTICRISKIIPGHARGRLMGMRSTVSGIFELSGSLAMGFLLKINGYPVNYAILFLIVFVTTSVSMVFIGMNREMASEDKHVVRNEKGYYRNMLKILKTDRSYAFFILFIILMTAFGKMPFAFQTIYAKERLGITTQGVFAATIVLLVSQIIGYLIWGYIGDKRGYKFTLLFASAIFLPAILLTYLMTNQFVFLLSIFLLGISQSALNINTDNLSISLCRDKARVPTYIGLRCLVTGPFIAFGSLIGGFIIDGFGYNTLFLLSAVFVLAGLYTLSRGVQQNDSADNAGE